MKISKSIVFGILIYLIGFSILSGIPNGISTSESIGPENVTSPNPTIYYPSNGETVGIIVSPIEWMTGNPTFHMLVNQYYNHLNQTGYNVLLQTNAIGGGTVQELKAFIQGWYTVYNISGVVLIGTLAYAQYYHPASSGFPAETFACDLYLMDMDGTWTDTSPADGIYDGHTDGTGDIEPEIYVARIDASTRTMGGSNVQELNNLLAKLVQYRTGGVSRTHRGISYIDDDFQAWANGTYDNWPDWLDNPYSTNTEVHTPATSTTAADWLTRLTQDYEWAHLACHSGSSPGTHYFGPGGLGEGTITSTQINTTRPTYNFYNLYCCHGADFITADCLATTYLFASDYSIAVIGTTKTGGMWEGQYFYNPLSQDKTIGESFNTWFQGMATYSPAQYVEWFYGMVILGDPFLTIDYDISLFEPLVTSSTHPNQASNYNISTPLMNWTNPVDVNFLANYYIFDQNPNTIPTPSSGTFAANPWAQPSSTLDDGTWYFHLLTSDSAGNSNVVHYTLNIDTSTGGPGLFGFPPYIWYIIIGGAVVMVILLIIVVARKMKSKSS